MMRSKVNSERIVIAPNGRSTFPERDDVLYERSMNNFELVPDEEALKRQGATIVHPCLLGYTEPAR